MEPHFRNYQINHKFQEKDNEYLWRAKALFNANYKN